MCATAESGEAVVGDPDEVAAVGWFDPDALPSPPSAPREPSARAPDSARAGAGPDAGCVFCAIADGNAPVSLCYEDAHCLAFLDLRQFNDGHVLVIPRAHIPDLRDASPESPTTRR